MPPARRCRRGRCAPGTRIAAGFVEDDFEYIELLNVSGTLTLDLGNVRLTKGVDFDFAGSAVTSLPPGARVLAVKNPVAFALRYGAGKPVAGVWQEGDNFRNSGELVKVSFGAGDAVQEFLYDDAAPWPLQADEGGWSPIEYAFGGTPTAMDAARLPVMTVENHTVNGFTEGWLTLTIRRPLSAGQAAAEREWSDSLSTGLWSPSGTLVSSTTDRDTGTFTEIWRAPLPSSSGGARLYGRVRVVGP